MSDIKPIIGILLTLAIGLFLLGTVVGAREERSKGNGWYRMVDEEYGLVCYLNERVDGVACEQIGE